MPKFKRRVRTHGVGIPAISFATVIQNFRIKTGKPFTSESAGRHITIVHPHTYAEESNLAPKVVQTIADALDSISAHSVPELVISAGHEASRVRNSIRTSAASPDDVKSLLSLMTRPTSLAHSVVTKASRKSDGTNRNEHELSPSIITPPSYHRSSFEFPKSRPVSGAPSLAYSALRKKVRHRKAFCRRFVRAWKRITAQMRRRLQTVQRSKARGESVFPAGFEPVALRSGGWWRSNSFCKRRSHVKSERASRSCAV